MARKNKQLPLYENLTITDVAAEGNALARVDNMVVFIPYGAPGDVVDAKVIKKKRSYAIAKIERMVSPSANRTDPVCEHFGVCGGCRWQHLPYPLQLQCKQQQVYDALTRIGKVNFPEILPIKGSANTYEYRNKMEYTFSNKSWLTDEQMRSGEEITDRNAAGFHISGAFDKVLDINHCHLQDNIGDRIRLFVKDYGKKNNLEFYDLKNQHGFLRTLMIRITSTGKLMVVMVFGENRKDDIHTLLNALLERFPEITSLQYVVNTKCNDTISDQEVIPYSGAHFIEEEMEGLKFRISPKSFYQTNSLQAYELYKVVRDFAELSPDDLVYDLYTGTGTIANFVSRQCKKVIGIEYVQDAIEDAKINSQVNNIENTLFFAGDMKDVLNDKFIAEHGRPQVMIIDPPRAGMHEDVVKVIINAAPERIVYVSCNPSTQARDLAMMNRYYEIEAVQPVDMFPNTVHVENVVKMRLRSVPLPEQEDDHSCEGKPEAATSEEL